MITLLLPFPPSVNTYWRHPTKGKLAGRHLISEKGRQYREDVIYTLGLSKTLLRRMEGRLSVRIVAHVPDRRQRDLDNMLKALLDALTHAGVWHDDSAIDHLSIQRGPIKSGGEVQITIEEMSDGDPIALCHGCSGAICRPIIENKTT